jgi:chlorobactene glucosyltransferase
VTIAGLLRHAVAATALGYAVRALQLERGVQRIPPVASFPDAPLLSIVVPARNEERNIEDCVRSLLGQRGVDAEVIVVDDASTDRTRAILATLAAEFPGVRIVDGAPLPEGWAGKPWACAQGAQVARGAWLLFTDADSRHAPDAAASTLAFAVASGADALSIMTHQELGTFAERALLPAILGLILFATGSVAELNDPAQPEHALANGQFILVERRAYEALGGHAALRGEIVEDIAFARRLKADGRFRLLLADGTAFVRVRMYRSFAEIWNGFAKNVYLGARGNLPAIAGGVTLCLALSVAPPLLALDAAVRRRPGDVAEALAATLAVTAVAYRNAPFGGFPARMAWLAPLGIAAFAAIGIESTRRALSGRGVEWRGRRYDARADAGAF